MKKKFLFPSLFIIISALVVVSCKKQLDAENIKTSLKDNLSFRNYVSRGMARKLELTAVMLRSIPKSKASEFQNALSPITESNQAGVQSIFSKYSLNFNVVYILAQKDYADQLKLLEKIPALKSLSDMELQAALDNNYRAVATQFFEKSKLKLLQDNHIGGEKETVETSTTPDNSLVMLDDETQSGINNDFDFETFYASIPTDMTESEIQGVVDDSIGSFLTMFATGGSPGSITAGEVFGCIGTAALSGVGSLLTIGGLHKMLETGDWSGAIRKVVGILVKNSGWVTAAVIAYSFTSCMWNAYEG